MKYIYLIYQYLVALPILILITSFTALVTLLSYKRPNNKFANYLQRFWGRCFCYLLFIPVTVTGRENINKDESYVFISNHQSYFDVFVIYGWLPIIFKWVMAKGFGKIPLVGAACRATGHILIDRSNRRASYESFQQAEKILRGGVSVVIFPEGTRSRSGEVAPFKRGAFQMAIDLNLKIVPLSLSGCYEVMSPLKKYVTWHKISLHIGKPIELTQYEKENIQDTMKNMRELIIDNMEK